MAQKSCYDARRRADPADSTLFPRQPHRPRRAPKEEGQTGYLSRHLSALRKSPACAIVATAVQRLRRSEQEGEETMTRQYIVGRLVRLTLVALLVAGVGVALVCFAIFRIQASRTVATPLLAASGQAVPSVQIERASAAMTYVRKSDGTVATYDGRTNWTMWPKRCDVATYNPTTKTWTHAQKPFDDTSEEETSNVLPQGEWVSDAVSTTPHVIKSNGETTLKATYIRVGGPQPAAGPSSMKNRQVRLRTVYVVQTFDDNHGTFIGKVTPSANRAHHMNGKTFTQTLSETSFVGFTNPHGVSTSGSSTVTKN